MAQKELQSLGQGEDELAVVKRLGFLMEAHTLGDAGTLRELVVLSKGFSPLDPLLPRKGKHDRRWGLQVNVRDLG